MKQPSELSREELESVALQIRDILWQDPVTGRLDPERSWTVETLEWVSGVIEDTGLKPDMVPPASPTTEKASDARLRCPRCGERNDLFVRIDSLARLARDERSGALSLDLEDKAPADYEWRAFHCGRCGFESARDDFEEPAVVAMRMALEAFVQTIEATGGCVGPGREAGGPQGEEIVEFEDDRPVPAGDEDWPDLADCYLQACRALGRAPMVQDMDSDESPDDGGEAGAA